MAVVCNPEGGRVRKRLEAVRRAGRQLAGDGYREAVEQRGIARAVQAALAEGADLLCLVGGDGTVQAALTALDRAAGDAPWPLLAPVAGGTANVTARDLDAGERPERRLAALKRWRRGRLRGRRVRRAVLRVEHPGLGAGAGDGGPADEGSVGGGGWAGGRSGGRSVDRGAPAAVCGLFFGTGLAATGVRYFRDRLGGVEITGQGPGALTLLRVLWSLAADGLDERVEPGRLEVAVDGGPTRERSCLLCVAGTLERFLLKTRPYWGDGDGPIHFTLVERGARGLWRRLPRLATGRDGGKLTPGAGYHSRDARRVELRFDGPVVVDGELFRVRAAEGPVRIGVAAEPDWLTF